MNDLWRCEKCGTDSLYGVTLQSDFPRNDFPDDPGTQAGPKVKSLIDRRSSSKPGIKAVDL
jgi:hypothetical protein